MTAAKEEEQHLREKQLEQAAAEITSVTLPAVTCRYLRSITGRSHAYRSAPLHYLLLQAGAEIDAGDMRTLARNLEERKRLQRRINDARARGEEVVDIVRVCLAHHFVSTMQERTRVNRRHIHSVLLCWKAVALGESSGVRLSQVDAAVPPPPNEPESPKPRWHPKGAPRKKAATTRVAHVPEALLESKGSGSTQLYRVKWVGFSAPTWELAAKMARVEGFDVLLRNATFED